MGGCFKPATAVLLVNAVVVVVDASTAVELATTHKAVDDDDRRVDILETCDNAGTGRWNASVVPTRSRAVAASAAMLRAAEEDRIMMANNSSLSNDRSTCQSR